MLGLVSISLVLAVSVIIGLWGVRAARSTPDFLVASRRIVPGWNAMAIAGEYVSAASVLGLAGLLVKNGVGAMWYAVGFTAGYVLVAALVAGPMRRSGAYTVPDFAEYRLGSPRIRRMCGLVVVVIMLLYLIPQFKAAGVVLELVSGIPYWVGVVGSGLVVASSIAVGGMRSATYVQAFHYLLKLAFIAGPALFLIFLAGPERREAAVNPIGSTADWARPLLDLDGSGHPVLATISVLVATTLGAMGLPHVVMRFHTVAGARAARRVAVSVIVLLGLFYLFPVVYGLLGRVVAPRHEETDVVTVLVPGQIVPGAVGAVLMALVAAGAFAAFMSTSSGLLLALAGGLSHDLFGGSLPRLRLGIVVGTGLAVALALPSANVDINVLVGWAFAVAASTFCPLLTLGIWWRGLTATGATVGLLVGAGASTGAALSSAIADIEPGIASVLLAQPALWTVPLAFLTMAGFSRPGSVPDWADESVLRLHMPGRYSTEAQSARARDSV
ncbi:cation acetate symporter [Glycomyces buryatensis]|uniref:Cation acetate symporter n=1 Tax=Glycomyces buryatensis TaxID=2570927 RepID=A0A4S8QC80_9ACTN|nr:cation acetate symporter [Glycomyces buryatensis]THV38659.1 cation acetate symporter [Glycomyces buryatensis]